MKKKTVFVAHPIKGDIKGNIEKVLAICKEIHVEGSIIPVVPYIATLGYLDDSVEEERNRGIEANLEPFERGYVDELWLFGDRISEGMKREVRKAIELGIPVVCKTESMIRDFAEFETPAAA